MQKLKKYISKNYVLIAMSVVMLAAVFVRIYKFDDWLYFKMDQSRDALLISNVVENGPGYLPLLGPRAGAVKLAHGFLRLGPIYYYFQYAAAIVFHSTQPYVLAYPDLFFSILSIPMLFALAMLYFSKRNSLLIMTMYAFSFIIIQYSRFAWNPNSLGFFLLLSFYGLLRFLKETEGRWKKIWFAIWAIGIIIGSQLHFFGFFSLVGISGLLLMFHFEVWKKEKLKAIFERKALKQIAIFSAIGILVFAIFYTPVILSDIRNKGQNSKNFIEALTAKPEKKPILEKVSKDIKESAKYYCLVTTSNCYGSSMAKEVPSLALTGLIMLAGLILVVRGLRKEKDASRRDFLALLIFWVGVFSILTIPVSFQLRPRFFIVVFAIPFLFLGLIYEYLEERLKKNLGKKTIIFSLLATGVILTLNFHGTYAWFGEQAKSQNESFTIKRTLILKNKDGVTLGQLQGAADWIYGKHQAGKNLYYYVKPEHIRPIDFLLSEKRDEKLNFFTMKINQDPNAQFFAITPTKNGIEPVTKKFGGGVEILSSQQFGQITAYEINFRNRTVSDSFKLKKASGAEDRVLWKDIFNFNSSNKK